MKKYLLLVLTCMLVMFSFINVKAEEYTIGDVSCFYKFYYNNKEVGSFQFEILGFNDGKPENNSVKWFYQSQGTSKWKNSKTFKFPVGDDKGSVATIKANEFGDRTFYYHIKDTIATNKAQPTLYATFYPAGQYYGITLFSLAGQQQDTYGNPIIEYSEPIPKSGCLYRKDKNSEYVSLSSSSEPRPQTDENKYTSRTCSGTNGDGYNFSLSLDNGTKTKMSFTRKYEKDYAGEHPYSYSISVSGEGVKSKTIPIQETHINNGFDGLVEFTNGGSTTFQLESSLLQSLYWDEECPKVDEIFVSVSVDDPNKYIVTDDEKEAAEGVGGVYSNGAGDMQGNVPDQGYSGDLNIMFGDPDPIKGGYENCKDLLGNSLSTLIKTIRILLQVAGCAICLINGMLSFTSAIATKDPQALAKAGRKLAIMLCILAAIILLPTLIRVLVRLVGGYDLSCI